MAATMKDIARRTGLGLATISSYFNGGNVREKNRIKIEEAIQELHYEVNEVARGLKTNATKTIGVVIPELNNTFCAEIITGMEDVLRSHGYATGRFPQALNLHPHSHCLSYQPGIPVL